MAFIVAVIGLGIWAVWSMAASYTKNAIDAGRYAAERAEGDQEAIKRTCVDPATMAECVTRIIQTTQEQQRAEHDLSAQKDMAHWALWMMAIAGLSTIVTAIGIYFVRENLIAVQEANAGAKEAILLAREDQRAWVTFHLDTATLEGRVETEHGLKISVKFTYTLDNLGHQPAVDTYVFCTIFRSDGFFEYDAPERFIAEALKKYPASSRQTIYPRQPTPINQFTGQILKDEPTSSILKQREFLACVVLYRTAGDHTVRHLVNIYDTSESVLPDGREIFLRYGAAERIS